MPWSCDQRSKVAINNPQQYINCLEKKHVVSRTWAKKCICQSSPLCAPSSFFQKNLLYAFSIHEVDTNPHFECPKRSLPRFQVTYVRFNKQISPQKTRSFDQWLQIVWLSKENHRFGSCFFFPISKPLSVPRVQKICWAIFVGPIPLVQHRLYHPLYGDMWIFGVHPSVGPSVPDTSGDSRMRMFVKASSTVLGRNLNGVSWFSLNRW